MESKQSFCVHALLLMIGGVTQCLAVKQITVLKGRELTLSCPMKNVNNSDHVEWRNPDGFLMFFNEHKALRDERNEFVTLTSSEYTVRISDVMFKDGGFYKCLHYAHPVVTRIFKVIVLSDVIMEKTEDGDKTLIKCTASANDRAPRLSWLLDNGLEIDAFPNQELESASHKYTVRSLIQVKTMKRPTTVKCLARHPAIRGSPLIDFIHIGPHGKEIAPTSEYTTTSTPTEKITATLVPLFSSTSFGNTMHTSNQTQPETTDAPETANSTMSYNNNTKVNETTGSVSETTEGTAVNASTATSNNTLGDGEYEHERSERGSSSLLVLLVTCLIFCLIVVIAFFLLRLKRAHIAWKQENEETDQSVESSRSKSSNEERQKQNQQQRGRGFMNTSFTKYKVEEAAASGTRTPPAAVEVPDEKPQHLNHTVLKSCVRETEL